MVLLFVAKEWTPRKIHPASLRTMVTQPD